MSEWRPIETAPRDGTPFLTYSTDAADESHKSALGTKGSPVMVMAWLMGEPHPVNEHGDFELWAAYDPTHWMPLPDPPDA